MAKHSFFRPGQTVVLREIWNGKVWSARPQIVVQDKPDLLALYLPPGTIWKQPKTLKGERVTAGNRARSEWIIKDEKLAGYQTLRLTIPGAIYSVLLFWDGPDINHSRWYINMEYPLRRTAMGFEYIDQFLDVIVNRDLSRWHWEDEDELEEAVALGVVSNESAAAMRAEGEKVAAWLQSGKSPFNGWEKWRPDPAWKIPVLLVGWDKI